MIELFRLDQDPGEAKNLAASEPKRTAAMLMTLQEHRRLKIKGIPDFMADRKGFVAPKNWHIAE